MKDKIIEDMFNKYNNILEKIHIRIDKIQLEMALLSPDDAKYQKLNNRLKKLENESREIEEKQDYLFDSAYFQLDESLDIITYAVGQIEEKKFTCKRKKLSFWYYYNTFLTLQEFDLIYLVEEGKEELANSELEKRFPNCTTLEEKEKSANFRIANSSVTSDFYIQIAFAPCQKKPGIRFRNLELSSYLDPFEGLSQYQVSSSIFDQRYAYIVSLMDTIQLHKIERYGETLTLDDMYSIANDFIRQYQSTLNGPSLK